MLAGGEPAGVGWGRAARNFIYLTYVGYFGRRPAGQPLQQPLPHNAGANGPAGDVGSEVSAVSPAPPRPWPLRVHVALVACGASI